MSSEEESIEDEMQDMFGTTKKRATTRKLEKIINKYAKTAEQKPRVYNLNINNKDEKTNPRNTFMGKEEYKQFKIKEKADQQLYWSKIPEAYKPINRKTSTNDKISVKNVGGGKFLYQYTYMPAADQTFVSNATAERKARPNYRIQSIHFEFTFPFAFNGSKIFYNDRPMAQYSGKAGMFATPSKEENFRKSKQIKNWPIRIKCQAQTATLKQYAHKGDKDVIAQDRAVVIGEKSTYLDSQLYADVTYGGLLALIVMPINDDEKFKNGFELSAKITVYYGFF